MKLEGYVIVQPISPWDEKYRETIIPLTSYSTFGHNAAEAWSKKTGKSINDIDFPIHVQRYHDRGYRLKRATLEIIDDQPAEFEFSKRTRSDPDEAGGEV